MIFPKHYPDIPKWKGTIKNTEISNRKKKGQKELFIEVWNEVAPYCTKCGKIIKKDPVGSFQNTKYSLFVESILIIV